MPSSGINDTTLSKHSYFFSLPFTSFGVNGTGKCNSISTWCEREPDNEPCFSNTKSTTQSKCDVIDTAGGKYDVIDAPIGDYDVIDAFFGGDDTAVGKYHVIDAAVSIIN